MMKYLYARWFQVGLLFLLVASVWLGAPHLAGAHYKVQYVRIPEEDRFTPFGLTIHVGDSVQWTNYDTDDHTVVSDDFFNTDGHKGTDQLLPGTDTTGGQPSTYTLRFIHPGQFVYYCRF